MKKLLTMIMVLVVLSTSVAQAQIYLIQEKPTLPTPRVTKSDIKLFLRGELARNNTVIIDSNTSYVPVATVAEAFGLQVRWNPDNGGSIHMTGMEAPGDVIFKDVPDNLVAVESAIELYIDCRKVEKEIIIVYPEGHPELGRSYLPLRGTCDMLGLNTEWNGDKRTINITYMGS